MKKKTVLMLAASVVALPALAVTLDRYRVSDASPGMQSRVSPVLIPKGRLPLLRMAANDATRVKKIAYPVRGVFRAGNGTPRFLPIRSWIGYQNGFREGFRDEWGHSRERGNV